MVIKGHAVLVVQIENGDFTIQFAEDAERRAGAIAAEIIHPMETLGECSDHREGIDRMAGAPQNSNNSAGVGRCQTCAEGGPHSVDALAAAIRDINEGVESGRGEGLEMKGERSWEQEEEVPSSRRAEVV